MSKISLPSDKNSCFMIAVGALSGIGGSIALIALLICASITSVLLMIVRRGQFLITRSDLFLLVPATVFITVQLLFAALNGHDYLGTYWYLIKFMGPLALFLLPWFVIPLFRKNQVDVLGYLCLGASVCLIFPLPLVLYQVFISEDRATGVTGNALPFALICAIFSFLSLFNVVIGGKLRHRLGWIGFIIGIFNLLLSGSIGLLPVVIPAVIIFGYINRQIFAHLYTRRNKIIGSVVGVMFVIAASQWTERFVNMALFLVRPDGSKKFRTFNFRLEMWDAAVDLIKARPLLGYGMENRVALLHQKTGLDFIQFHNAILNAWVDSGILGVLATVLLLIAPLWIAIRAPRDPQYGIRLFIAAYLTAIFAVGGMSYVMFMDNVYDSVFLWVAVAIAVSVPVSKSNPLLFHANAGP